MKAKYLWIVRSVVPFTIATLWLEFHAFSRRLADPEDSIHHRDYLSRQSRHRRLEFVSYTSSEWESLWLENLDKWIRPDHDADNPAASETCRQLATKQAHFVHDFLNLTCTTRLPHPYDEWCRYDDHVPTPIYYLTTNRTHFDLSVTPPEGLLDFETRQIFPIRPQPVIPSEKDEHVVSKFVFRDTETGEELVEYIEPLVSHLRFPLAGCLPKIFNPAFSFDDTFILTKSYIIPPSPAIRSSRRRIKGNSLSNPYHGRFMYFDAGSSSWAKGLGGASLIYFTHLWQRHGILFDKIYAFEATTSSEKFYQSVPDLFWSDRTFYQQAFVSSKPEDDTLNTPFIPKFIQRHAEKDDYVIFKLDIDSPGVEAANIEYLVDSNDSHLWIDELFWEHHVVDNPFMDKYWFPPQHKRPTGWNKTDNSMRSSYNYFLKLRNLGIRAHSWV